MGPRIPTGQGRRHFGCPDLEFYTGVWGLCCWKLRSNWAETTESVPLGPAGNGLAQRVGIVWGTGPKHRGVVTPLRGESDEHNQEYPQAYGGVLLVSEWPPHTEFDGSTGYD